MPSFSLLDRFLHGPACTPPKSMLPLQGLTVLAVEDSRFASDALRLMCQRSGARLRRVDRLQAAYAHLRVYRPDVMLVDMGLPDGRGDALIHDLAQHRPHGPVIIAISGDPDARTDAMRARAHGFLEKPFAGLVAFQQAILQHLPDRAMLTASGASEADLSPDPLALHDDLAHAANLIRAQPDPAQPNPAQRSYLAGFVTGIARSSNDATLAAAAADALSNPAEGIDRLQRLLTARIAEGQSAFRGQQP